MNKIVICVDCKNEVKYGDACGYPDGDVCEPCRNIRFDTRKKHCIENDIGVAYVWYHTQNGDGKHYAPKEHFRTPRTLEECINQVEAYRESRAEGEERRLQVTYHAVKYVDSEFRKDETFMCGTMVERIDLK